MYPFTTDCESGHPGSTVTIDPLALLLVGSLWLLALAASATLLGSPEMLTQQMWRLSPLTRPLTEESFYYFAPIAVAIVAYLLESRREKHYERKEEDINGRMRTLELAFVNMGAAQGTANAIVDKCLERINERLDTLEGADGGLPKEEGDKIKETLTQLRDAYATAVIGVNNCSARIDNLETPDEVAPARKRGRRA